MSKRSNRSKSDKSTEASEVEIPTLNEGNATEVVNPETELATISHEPNNDNFETVIHSAVTVDSEVATAIPEKSRNNEKDKSVVIQNVGTEGGQESTEKHKDGVDVSDKALLESPSKELCDNVLDSKPSALIEAVEPHILSDTLDAAINEALTADVSVGSLSFFDKTVSNIAMPGSSADSGSGSSKGGINICAVIKTLRSVMPGGSNSGSLSSALKPTATPVMSSKENVEISAPVGETSINLSEESPFARVSKGENSGDVNTASGANDKELLNTSSTKLLADTISDLSKSPPFSPFSPFSPFGLEIQNITAAAAAQATKNNQGACHSQSVASKVRRITPIPVKGMEEKTDSSSSFQAAVMNSPLISDSPIKKPETENATSENNILCTGLLGAVKSLTTSKHLETGVSASAQDSGSNSKPSGESGVSNKSDSNLGGSQTSISMGGNDQGVTSISISLPEVFSENANVGFPRLQPQSQQPSSLLSEESLFQCLGKPLQYNDTLPTVSNLTNILHALDGKSQAFDPDKAVSASNTNCNAGTLNTEAQSHGNKDGGGNAEPSVSSSSSEGETGQYFPQSMQSIENMARIKLGLFKVSQLSDSDSSGKPSPSESLTRVTNETIVSKEQALSGTGNKEIDGGSSITEGVVELDNEARSVKELDLSDAENVQRGNKVQVKSLDNASTKKDQRRQRKMSRRELRKSLQGTTSFTKDSKSGLQVETERQVEDGGSNDGSVTREISCITEVETGNSSRDCLTKEGSEEICDEASAAISESKTKDMVASIKSEVDADNASCCDSLSDASSRGKKRHKHKSRHRSEKKKKKKKRREDQESDSPVGKEKRKRRRTETPTDITDADHVGVAVMVVKYF